MTLKIYEKFCKIKNPEMNMSQTVRSINKYLLIWDFCILKDFS